MINMWHFISFSIFGYINKTAANKSYEKKKIRHFLKSYKEYIFHNNLYVIFQLINPFY